MNTMAATEALTTTPDAGSVARIAAVPALPLRIVVADESYLVREGMRRALDGEDDLEVLEFCSSLPALERAVEEHEPDVVVTGIRMPPSQTDEGIRLAVALRDSHPGLGVVVVSQFLMLEYAVELFERGSAGRAYLLKEKVGHQADLMAAIRAVARGGSVIDPAVTEVLVEERVRAETSPLRRLSWREQDVLAGVAAGKSNAAIAESLCLTKRAVEKNINGIFAKLQLASDAAISQRVAAALLYVSAHDDSAAEGGPAHH